MRIRPRLPEARSRRRAGAWVQPRRRLATLLPVVALCAAIGIIAGFWYTTEGWPAANRWLGQRLPRSSAPGNDLPTLALSIDAKAFRTLERHRASAVERGIWIRDETDWQPLQIELGQETIPARVRLDGDQADHWQAGKWSLWVQLQQGAALLGMHSFSLRSPATCGYLNGWLYAEDLRRAGIHAPQHTFVNVSVNGDDWGVYAAVEHVSAHSLAAQGRAEGVIVRFDGRPLAAAFDLPVLAEIESPDGSNTVDDPGASSESAAAWDLVRGLQDQRLTPSQVFDPAQVGRHLAHADLWGAGERLGWQGEHFYYDPATAKLEPVAGEVPSLDSTSTFAAGLAAEYDLPIMDAYVQEVLRISQPAVLDALRQENTAQFERYYAALAQEFYPAYLEPPWQALGERQELLWEALHPVQAVQAYQVNAQDDSLIELQLANLLPYPVALLQLHVGQQQLDVRPEWLADADWIALHEEARPAVVLKGARATIPHYITLRIPSSVLVMPRPDASAGSGVLRITTRLVGTSDETTIDVQPDPRPAWPESSHPVQPTAQEVLRQHPFLSRAEQPGYLAIAPGTWHVRGDLILPEGFGLWATQPVTLTFDREAILFASGPLVVQGTNRDPIRLLPHRDEWAGLVVYRAGRAGPSSLDHVEVRGTTGLARDGWRLPAGLTFYESPLVLRRCRLLDSTAPAALYVSGAAFALTDTEFGQALFDGFRGDLAQGKMERCAIHDVLGRGIALFRSSLAVRDTVLLRIYGQGISGAVGSEVTAQGIRSQDTGITFASKDSSFIEVQDARIAQAWSAAFAAYLEEQAYGPASIYASQIVFEDDSTHAWLEDGNNVTIEGIRLPAGAPDAVRLSRRHELAPTARVEHHRFGPALRLVGYDLPGEGFQAGTSLPLTLYWQASAKLGQDYTVFVHVLDRTGHIAAQWDAMPRQNTFVTTAWPVGEIVDDPHPVPLPGDMPAGEYRIALGVYDAQTSDRLPAFGPDGEPVANAAVLLERVVEVE